MNYTKELYDAGKLPSVGMKAKYGEGLVDIIGFKTNGAIVFETHDGFTYALCSPTDNHSIKPIDLRTDTEKAVDDIEACFLGWIIPASKQNTANLMLSDIKAGKISDVKWVGND